MSVPIVRTIAELRTVVAGWRRSGANIAVVPTMGALHEGHSSLVRSALQKADRVIVTLFVNPKQFNSAADLAAYPRMENEDAAKLTLLGAGLLYVPDATEMYPDGFATTVSVSGVSESLCGAFRPGHFDGVATVVAKLFLQTGADFAFFGEKDFQQLQLIRRMVRDLDIPITVVPCPTVREADGLALSSRNVRLSPAERAVAPRLASVLLDTASGLSNGSPVLPTLAEARAAILSAGYREVEYLELRGEADLQPIASLDRPARLFAAAWLGETRLIDNVRTLPSPLLVDKPPPSIGHAFTRADGHTATPALKDELVGSGKRYP
ncbi:pantoate--beta-alanine ligase [Mesorhizobium sp. M0959]|uniref:pantoate--beta-alanine ligase n=1 Tax=unclassified Mesorhizobium TaxID=325217 RepID=UPI003338D2AD